MSNIGTYWKAVIGFIAPGVVILASSITAGSDGGTHITSTEWITALIACVLTSAGVAVKANDNFIRTDTGPKKVV